MGTYTGLVVEDYELVSSKSAVVPEVMTIFREYDKVHLPANETEDNYFGDVVKYEVKVNVAAQRLDLMGFTLERVKREYAEIRASLIADTRELLEDSEMEGYYLEKLSELESLSFENYFHQFSFALDTNIQPYMDAAEDPSLDAIMRYIVSSHQDEWYHFGFFCNDVRCFLRMALAAAKPDATIAQDISQLVNGAYYSAHQEVCREAVHSLLERYPENAPRIIVTEGSSDASILEKSLRVLHPHLVEYFTFFDFDGPTAPGGAPQAVNLMKSFAAVGIANRVIAVLDNDTAARDAMRALKVKLPSNLAIVQLPTLDWLEAYPTIGPAGEAPVDVNGKAAAMELYLGRDILSVDGNLIPIRWKGYSASSAAYQGEILKKDSVLERWQAKADRCLKFPESVEQEHWDDLRKVWEKIIQAFL